MLLKYIGHSCFYIQPKNGARIIIDPYDNSLGLKPVREEADIVLISHHHFDHDYTAGISGSYELFDKPGSFESNGVKLTGLEVSHDEAEGAKRGMVVCFIIEADGMRLMHLGDIGDIPGEEFFSAAGKIDILMIPVGGNYTIDAEKALEIIDRMSPNISIPMHYKSSRSTLDIEGLHVFERLAKSTHDVSLLRDDTFEITADSLKKRGRILLMENSY